MQSRPRVVAVAQVLPATVLPAFPRVVTFVPASAKGRRAPQHGTGAYSHRRMSLKVGVRG
jgi:hypothetical protein